MSSDIDELVEEVEMGGDVVFQSPNTTEQDSSGRQRHSSGRRCSLPCDRTSNTIRRHLQQFKCRRKISAPSSGPPPAASSHPKSAASSPMESTTGGFPLAELFERLRPAGTGTSRRASTADSGVSDPGGPVARRRLYSMDAYSTVSWASSSPGRTGGSADEGFHSGFEECFKKPLFVDTHLANIGGGNGGPATVPRRCLYYRQSSASGVTGESSQVPRPRSNSEAGRYFLMRKCADERGEFVGKLDEGEWAYCQILATLKCYDLMPAMAKMVVFDSNLPIRKAFLAFVNNDVRAAPIWDGQKKLFIGLLTVTDLMHLLLEYADSGGGVDPATSSPITSDMAKTSSSIKNRNNFDETLDLPLNTRTTVAAANFQRRCDSPTTFFPSGNHHHQPYHLNHLIYALADETATKAAKLLCDRRLHRLLILDPEKGGNPLFLLSKKDVLKALRKYIAKLPLPLCMEKTLDELRIGTWTGLVTITWETSVHHALTLFVGKGLSALPVVDSNDHLLDMLTKVDLMNLVVASHGQVDIILQSSIKDAIENRRQGLEKMTTCSRKATMMLAVECILHSGAHRLAIVDSEGRLEGVLSLADLMRFLTSGFS